VVVDLVFYPDNVRALPVNLNDIRDAACDFLDPFRIIDSIE
jgi:hypothetical protein